MPPAGPNHSSRPARRRRYVEQATSGNYLPLGPSKSIDFRAYPSWNPITGSSEPTEEQLEALGNFIQQCYGVWKYFIVKPFIFFCMANRSSKAPPIESSPFTLVGLLVIWIYPDCKPFRGLRFWHHIKTDNRLSMDLVCMGLEHDILPFKIPATETLQAIGQGFPEATHINFYNARIIIDLPKTSPQDYRQKLQTLPTILNGSAVKIYYRNGPLALPVLEEVRSLLPEADSLLYGEELGIIDAVLVNIGSRDPTIRIKCLGKRLGLIPVSSGAGRMPWYPCQHIFINSQPERLGSYLCLSPTWMHQESSDDDAATLVDIDDADEEASLVTAPEETAETVDAMEVDG